MGKQKKALDIAIESFLYGQKKFLKKHRFLIAAKN